MPDEISLDRFAPPPRAAYQGYLSEAAAEYGIEDKLPYLQQMLNVESGGDPKAKSKKGARGLMQLMPGTARAMGVKDPNDPQQNIRGGVRYFKEMLDQFGGDTIGQVGRHMIEHSRLEVPDPYEHLEISDC